MDSPSNIEPDKISWTITVEEDPDTGELILPLPAELLALQGWVTGDLLDWKENPDGSWTLSKVER